MDGSRGAGIATCDGLRAFIWATGLLLALGQQAPLSPDGEVGLVVSLLPFPFSAVDAAQPDALAPSDTWPANAPIPLGDAVLAAADSIMSAMDAVAAEAQYELDRFGDPAAA